jgi:3'-5' exoribonuclease
MFNKKQFIKDLKKDEIVNDIFVVKFKKPVESYKNGYKFELRLGDSSKEIMLKYWGSDNEDVVQKIYDTIKKDDVILIQGRVNEWNNNLEISSNYEHTIKVLNQNEYSKEDFIRKTDKNIDEMFNEILNYIELIENEDIKNLVEYFYKDDLFVKKFKVSPAAMYIHHGWIGGLLEHTLHVLRNALDICKWYNVNKDLVIAGCFFHDMGKLREFSLTTNIGVTNEGMLVGHVTIGCEMLNKAMDKLNTPNEIRMKLIHIIISHMGDYGSNKLPAFPEALIVYMADRIDADLIHMLDLIKEANTEDDSIYDKNKGMNIYLR